MSETSAIAAPSIAVLLPCYNEAVAIGQTVDAFRRALPTAQIYVYDNNSQDATSDVARRAGAIVRVERQQGKGAVVRRMFADIDADIYVLADGDDTYDANAAAQLVERVYADRLDMITGVRKETDVAAYRPGHRFGNQLLTGLVRWVFNAHVADMLSGYRVLSRLDFKDGSGGQADIFTREQPGQSRFVFFQGHPEYDPGTLGREYLRDMGRFLRGETQERPGLPENYFDRATEDILANIAGETDLARYNEIIAGALPRQLWRSNTVRLFGNWLTLVAATKARRASSRTVHTRRRAS